MFTVLLVLTSAAAHTQDGLGQPVQAAAQSDPAVVTQVPAQASPAHIALVEGSATVDRDGLSQPAAPNAPFLPGDRLRTARGRAEAFFADGTILDVDEQTTVDLQAPDLVRVASGRIILIVPGAGNPSASARYRIDTPSASARANGAGEYHVAVVDGSGGIETELAVVRGSASLDTERGSVPLAAGELTIARDGGAPSFPQTFNSARLDAFARWSEGRQEERLGAASARYLPPDLRMYGGTFDRDGTWEETPQYGYVWYPEVAPNWQPYYDGYWAPYRPWGWTWIGFDSWSWPTHHFGRWGFFGHRWFWIPGRTWAPAWVYWGSAPGFVSWCPLGFDGGPVFAFSVGFSHRWSGWTVVPRSTFGLVARVDRVAVAPHLIPPANQFAFQHAAPVAVPRLAQAPVGRVGQVGRAGEVGRAGAVAVPRNGAVAGGHVWNEQALHRAYPNATPLATAASRAGTAVPRWNGAPLATPRNRSAVSPLPLERRAVQPAPTAPRRFERAPATIPRLERAPAATPRFERAPAAAPRFESAPARAPRFERGPIERAPMAAPRFERPPAATPRFERAPASTPRVERAPAAVPRFERAPATSPRFERPAAPPVHSMPAPSMPRSAPMAVPRSVESAPHAGDSPRGAGSGGSPSGAGHHRR